MVLINLKERRIGFELGHRPNSSEEFLFGFHSLPFGHLFSSSIDIRAG
jgi:hypothetical protein